MHARIASSIGLLSPRHRASSFVLGATLLLGCVASGQEPPKSLVVEPGDVVDQAGIVTGSFKLIAGYDVGAHHIGIPSEGYGGACLMTDFGGPHEACSTQDDCHVPPQLPGGQSECLAANEHAQTMSCWYKSEDWCVKRPPPPIGASPPLEVNKTMSLPKVQGGIHTAALHKGKNASWMVVACLNGIDAASGKSVPDCGRGGPQKLMQLGKQKQVKGRGASPP